MLMEAESAAHNNDLKSLYKINRKTTGKHHFQKKVIKDKNGIPLGSTEEQMQRWVEFFTEIWNKEGLEKGSDVELQKGQIKKDLDINLDIPTK
jgi:hypothetical protein